MKSVNDYIWSKRWNHAQRIIVDNINNDLVNMVSGNTAHLLWGMLGHFMIGHTEDTIKETIEKSN